LFIELPPLKLGALHVTTEEFLEPLTAATDLGGVGEVAATTSSGSEVISTSILPFTVALLSGVTTPSITW
jgi:hypothetical protein